MACLFHFPIVIMLASWKQVREMQRKQSLLEIREVLIEFIDVIWSDEIEIELRERAMWNAILPSDWKEKR